jgi:hypothetical protein
MHSRTRENAHARARTHTHTHTYTTPHTHTHSSFRNHNIEHGSFLQRMPASAGYPSISAPLECARLRGIGALPHRI